MDLSKELIKIAAEFDQHYLNEEHIKELAEFSDSSINKVQASLTSAISELKKAQVKLSAAIKHDDMFEAADLLADLDKKLSVDLDFSKFLSKLNGLNGLFWQSTHS